MKDLEEHLKSLESFSKGRGRQYGGLLGRHEDQPWNEGEEGPPPWMAKVYQAIEFLQKSGANPNTVELREGKKGKGPVIGIRLKSVDGEGLAAYLKGLGSAKAVAQWVESGVEVGAVSVRGERVFLVAQSHHAQDAVVGVSGERGVDCTESVLSVAHTLMESEVEPTLNTLAQAKADGGGAILRFRPDIGEGDRQILHKGNASNPAASRLQRKKAQLKPLADGRELGADPKFVVSGPAIESAGGRYFPVRAVDSHSRRMLSQMGADGIQVGRGGLTTFVRADYTEPVDIAEDIAATQPDNVGIEGDGDDARRRGVAAAYNLLHGLTLAPGEGKPLDAGVASRMERFFGTSFGHVKVHSGRLASEVTDALAVEAVSVGAHVVIPQQLLNAPDGRGERVLVHELTHVHQHQRGSDEGRSHKEMEADLAVNQFMSGRRYSPVTSAQMSTRAPAPPPPDAGAMPMTVYASAQRKVELAERKHRQESKKNDLRSEGNIRKIADRISRRERKSLENKFDRKG